MKRTLLFGLLLVAAVVCQVTGHCVDSGNDGIVINYVDDSGSDCGHGCGNDCEPASGNDCIGYCPDGCNETAIIGRMEDLIDGLQGTILSQLDTFLGSINLHITNEVANAITIIITNVTSTLSTITPTTTVTTESPAITANEAKCNGGTVNTYVQSTDTCYTCNDDKAKYSVAVDKCMEDGGLLLEVKSQEEWDDLQESECFKNQKTWIGLIYDTTTKETSYQSDNEPFNTQFNGWFAANDNGNGECIAVHKGKMITSECVSTNWYICKYTSTTD